MLALVLVFDVPQFLLSLPQLKLKHLHCTAVGISFLLQVVVLASVVQQLLLLTLFLFQQLLFFGHLLLDLILIIFESACLLLLLGLEGHAAHNKLLLHLLDHLLQRGLLLSLYLKQLFLALQFIFNALLILVDSLFLAGKFLKLAKLILHLHPPGEGISRIIIFIESHIILFIILLFLILSYLPLLGGGTPSFLYFCPLFPWIDRLAGLLLFLRR